MQIIEKENEIKKIKTESFVDGDSEELDPAKDVDEPLDKVDEE